MQTRTDPARCRVRSNVLQPVDAIATAIARGDRSATVVNVDFVGEKGAPPSSRMSLRSEAVTIVGEAREPEMAVSEPVGVRAAATAPRQPGVADSAKRATTTGDGFEAAKDDIREALARGSGSGHEPHVLVSRSSPDTLSRAAAARPSRPPARDRPSPRPRIRRVEPDDTPRAGAPDSGVTETVKLPGPGVTQTDASLIRRIETAPGVADLPNAQRRTENVLAMEGDCACRIRGTVEIHPDHLLTRRLELIVALREAPAVRDTIQLFMGSPRAFELAPLRCGIWHVDVDAVARKTFTIVSADGRQPLDCREGGLRQLRIVLEPR